MKAGELSPRPSAKFLRLSQLRRLRAAEQVAAVCYRVRSGGIEFLLVQTRGGRWTFPKGGVEPGLTHAQAAALEAFEEAGVHGRMEEASFARYVCRNLAVSAHLCEVLRLGPAQESKRNRTWFSAEKAKRRLRKDRTPADGGELARVVDRAVKSIQRRGGGTSAAGDVLEKDGRQRDALQRVRFEAFEAAGGYRVEGPSEAWFMRYLHRQRDEMRPAAAIEIAVNAYLRQVLRGKVLRLGPAQELNGNATGYSAQKAKRLRDDAPVACSTELARVVEIGDGRANAGRAKASGTSRKSGRESSPDPS